MALRYQDFKIIGGGELGTKHRYGSMQFLYLLRDDPITDITDKYFCQRDILKSVSHNDVINILYWVGNESFTKSYRIASMDLGGGEEDWRLELEIIKDTGYIPSTALSDAIPLADSTTGASGTNLLISRDDHQHPKAVATETVRGQIEIATSQETAIGVNSTKAIVPLTLKQETNKLSSTIETNRKNLQDQISVLEGIGGALPHHDFGVSMPSQAELTEYFLKAIWGDGGVFTLDTTDLSNSSYVVDGKTWYGRDIFNGTWIRNDFDNTRIVTNNGGSAFDFANVGVDVVRIATDTIAGIVRPSSGLGEISVNSLGVMKVNGSMIRNLGEIIQSILPLTDPSLHLLDGSEITADGVYKTFYEYIKTIHDSGSYSGLLISEADWQTSNSNYGACGKFVFTDGVSVRLPKINRFIETTNNVMELGDLTPAGLPNITGAINGILPRRTDEWPVSSGAFSNGGITYNGSGGNLAGSYININLDASLSNSIYGNSATVQPQSIKLLTYIVIA